jgi:hypothetical protein
MLKLNAIWEKIHYLFKIIRKPKLFVFYGKISLFFLVFIKVVRVAATELEFCAAQWLLYVELALKLKMFKFVHRFYLTLKSLEVL